MQLNGYKGNNMSLGGGSSSQQQLDPALRDLFLQNYGSAQTTAGGLKAREFAGFNPDQIASANISRQFADPNSQQMQQLGTAASLATSAGNYAPQQVVSRDVQAALAEAAQLSRGTVRDVNAERIASERVSGADVASEALRQIAPQARANIRDISAGSFLNQNIQKYMNPYTQAVTEQGLTDLERARQLEQIQTSAKATAAKSFGGSRQGVAEAETNRAYGDSAQRFIRQQNADAYEAAQRASEADLARDMLSQQLNQSQDLATTQQSLQLAGQFGLANQDAALKALQANQDAMLRASLANQGYDFNVGQLNTENTQQVNLANQASKNQVNLTNAANFLQANLANQAAGLQANSQRLGAAGQVANIANQGQQMGFAGANQLAQQGAVQQRFSQDQLDAIRNLPLEQQQILNQALGINVGGGSGTQASSTSRQGLLGLLGIG